MKWVKKVEKHWVRVFERVRVKVLEGLGLLEG